MVVLSIIGSSLGNVCKSNSKVPEQFNPLVTAPVNIVRLRTITLKKLQHLQIHKQNISEWDILSANNLLDFLHFIHQQKSLILSNFMGGFT